MLILSRRLGERIFIGDNIIIEVCEFGYGKVKIGVTAPEHIEVHREEVKREIDQQKFRAGEGN